MRTLCVVEVDPVTDDPLCLEPVGDFVQVNGLLFQGPPQSFDKDVVEISAPAIHRDFGVGFSQSSDPASTCVLTALIRVHYIWLAVSHYYLFQCFNAKAGIERI